jgi:hypothetical protein
LLILQRPTYVPNYTSLGELARKQHATLVLLEESELDSWHETKPTELTEALVRCRTRLRDFERDAQDLNDAVERWFRLHPAPVGVREWVIGHVLGAEEHELRALTPAGAHIPTVRAHAKTALESRLLKRHFRAYRAAEGRTERSIAALLDILVLEIRRQRPAPPASRKTQRTNLTNKMKAIGTYLTEMF